VNYRGDYEAYLYYVNKEIEAGEREQREAKSFAKGATAAAPKAGEKASAKTAAPPQRSEREIRKEMTTLERAIAKLDEQKKFANTQLMQTTDAKEALRLHNEVSSLTSQLADTEQRWFALQEQLGEV